MMGVAALKVKIPCRTGGVCIDPSQSKGVWSSKIDELALTAIVHPARISELGELGSGDVE